MMQCERCHTCIDDGAVQCWTCGEIFARAGRPFRPTGRSKTAHDVTPGDPHHMRPSPPVSIAVTVLAALSLWLILARTILGIVGSGSAPFSGHLSLIVLIFAALLAFASAVWGWLVRAAKLIPLLTFFVAIAALSFEGFNRANRPPRAKPVAAAAVQVKAMPVLAFPIHESSTYVVPIPTRARGVDVVGRNSLVDK